LGNILVPQEPTFDKQELVSFVTYLLVNEMMTGFGKKGVEKLKTLNNSQLRELHDIAVQEYEHLISSYIKKSLKLSYGGSRFIGLSSIEMNNYLTDLRMEMQKVNL
jgi:hypothetical protein